MATLSYREAAIRAVSEALDRDPLAWALGEDLGRGGVFGQYRGLQQRFGARRVVDTPISEATIMGAAVGAALVGTRPIVEMRFSDFALCAIDELVNQAAKNRYMFGGKGRVPIVARLPVGMWRASAAQHSQSLEAWFAHIPGLVVVCPATPADLIGLFAAAIRCDDPVVFMEHKDLWDLEGPVPPDGADAVVPLGVAETAREGADLTIVTWSKMRHICAEAADTLAADGIDAEVIDLRTIFPWDRDAVLASVRRTGRLMVVQEAVTIGGFGGEIAATVAEAAFESLKAPIRRLGAPRVPVPYAANLEAGLRITADKVAETARALV